MRRWRVWAKWYICYICTRHRTYYEDLMHINTRMRLCCLLTLLCLCVAPGALSRYGSSTHDDCIYPNAKIANWTPWSVTISLTYKYPEYSACNINDVSLPAWYSTFISTPKAKNNPMTSTLMILSPDTQTTYFTKVFQNENWYVECIYSVVSPSQPYCSEANTNR